MLKRTNIVASSVMVMVGIAAVNEGMSLDIGSMRRIGPGFTPLLLGGSALVLAVALLFSRDGDIQPEPVKAAIRPFLSIGAAFAAFAFAIAHFGLVPAVIATIVISSFASPGSRWSNVTLLALGVAGVTAVIFRFGLHLPLPLFQWV